MLDAWIIEKIRKEREEQRRPHEKQKDPPPRLPPEEPEAEREPERGVVIVDFSLRPRSPRDLGSAVVRDRKAFLDQQVIHQ